MHSGRGPLHRLRMLGADGAQHIPPPRLLVRVDKTVELVPVSEHRQMGAPGELVP